MKTFLLPSSILLVLALGGPAGAYASLLPPPGFTAPVQVKPGGDDRDCPAVPKPFTDKLDFPSKYEGSDSARDDANPEATRQYKDKTATINAFEKGYSRLVDRYMKSGDPVQLACSMKWLSTWSQADALTGAAENHTGKSMRKWALGSIASAYLRLKFSSSQPLGAQAQQARAAEAWMGRLADQVVREWSDTPDEKFNNHEYWAAWAVMATSVVLDRRDLFDWSLGHFKRAMAQIDAEGYLPNELARDTRALQYHNYSLPPLAMIAAFAKANGADVVHENGDALKRLAARTLSGIDDPSIFTAKTGKKQEKEGTVENSKFSWLEPYCWVYGCSGDTARRLAALRPLKTYRLGGDITALFAGLPPPRTKATPAQSGSRTIPATPTAAFAFPDP